MNPSEDVRLFADRWDMHALQALARRDHVTLRRVFTELDGQMPPQAVNTQVETFGFGAPMRFHSYGFLDRTASGLLSASKFLIDRAIQGDTLLLLALRHHDALSAVVLAQVGGSLEFANSAGETPLDMVYTAFSLFQLRERDASLLPRGLDTKTASRILSMSSEYAALFRALEQKLSAYRSTKTRSAREALMRIYSEHAPDRIAKVDAQLREFEFREEQLLDSVRKKYVA